MQSLSALKLEVAALTDVGCKRSNNEDSFGYDLSTQIFAVCDGMGGMAAGEVASSKAVAELVRCFNQQPSETRAEDRLYRAILHANRQVCMLADESDDLRGMGTTLVSACVDGRKVVVGNVGDSRAYLLRDGKCAQITLDHSYVAEQVRNGMMRPEDAVSSPLQSLITRAIGTDEAVEPDLFSAEAEPGDIVLLTTDGLTRYADGNTIARLILGTSDLQRACKSLIDMAKRHGAADNVTCLLLRFGEADESGPGEEAAL
jgi:serine/threonine protein phosphatase PrpC